ncbi:MAG: TrmH family RNA methyltransferase [Acidimicrobiales bacterium]
MRIEVDDPEDSRIWVFQGLRDHVLRRRREQPDGDMAGVFVAEGDIVVERALRAGYQLQCLLVDAKRTKPLPDAIDQAVPVYAAGPEVLQRITGYHLHRGVLACFKRRELLSFDDAVAGSRTVAVIEGVNNPTNLGVILRCAVALGVDSYFIDPTCCDPLYRRCGRVSMGESFATPYARLPAFPDGLAPLRAAGFELLALTPDPNAVPLNELRFAADQAVALLLGAEGPGLTEATMAACDRRVKIPMSGTTDSINVGSAAAVAFYAVAQARLSPHR